MRWDLTGRRLCPPGRDARDERAGRRGHSVAVDVELGDGARARRPGRDPVLPPEIPRHRRAGAAGGVLVLARLALWGVVPPPPRGGPRVHAVLPSRRGADGPSLLDHFPHAHPDRGPARTPSSVHSRLPPLP